MYPHLTSRSDVLKMLDEMIEVRQKILDACAQMSPEQLNDPVYPGTWSILNNLAHLAWAERFIVAHIKARPHNPARESIPPAPPLELAAIRTALDEAHAEAIAFLKANPESVLTQLCAWGKDLPEETVGGLYFHIIEHEIGHRTFVFHKLRKLQELR
jgi:uncharacterized damage-inducible protein DinB